MKTRIEHFGCRGCGGTLGMKEGERIVECSYCGERNLVDIDDHVPSHVVRPVLSLAQAKKAAMEVLKEKNLAADLAKSSFFHEAGLYYLPVYEMSGVRSGKIHHTDIKRVSDGFGEKLVETSKATVIMSDVYFKSPAARLSDWGIENMPLEKIRQGRKLHAFDPGGLDKEAMIFPPNVSITKFEDERTMFEGYLPGDQTKIVNKSLRIVYCPVWLVKYSYHGRLYRIVVDAVLGETLYARAPASDFDRIPVMLAVTLFCVYPMSRALRSIATEGIDIRMMLASGSVFAIPLLIFIGLLFSVVAFAWNQFRYASDAVWTGGVWLYKPINKPPETTLERIARAMSRFVDITPDDPDKKKRKWDL